MFKLFKKDDEKVVTDNAEDTRKADAIVKAFETALEKMTLSKGKSNVEINITNIDQVPQTIESQFKGMSPTEIVYFYNICKARLIDMESKFGKLDMMKDAAYQVIKETREKSKMPESLANRLIEEVDNKVKSETDNYNKFKASVDKLKGLHDMVASYVDEPTE